MEVCKIKWVGHEDIELPKEFADAYQDCLAKTVKAAEPAYKHVGLEGAKAVLNMLKAVVLTGINRDISSAEGQSVPNKDIEVMLSFIEALYDNAIDEFVKREGAKA